MKKTILDHAFWKRQLLTAGGGLDVVAVNDRALAGAMLAGGLLREPGLALVVVPVADEAERLQAEIGAWLKLCGDERAVQELPELRYRSTLLDLDAEHGRAVALEALRSAAAVVLVASAAAAAAVFPAAGQAAPGLTLRAGESGWHPRRLAQALTAMGYDNEVQVSVPGEFALRGGIVDVYPCQAAAPVRLEFFDEELEELRSFDVATQRSTGVLGQVLIRPRESAQEEAALAEHVGTASVLLYDVEGARLQLKRYHDAAAQARFERLVQGTRSRFLAVESAGPDWGLRALALAVPPAGAQQLQQRLLSAELAPFMQGHEIIVTAGAEGELPRLLELLREVCAQAAVQAGAKPSRLWGVVAPGLRHSLSLERERVLILSRAQLMGEEKTAGKPLARHELRRQQLLEWEGELREGDPAVHASHGVCLYRGMAVDEEDQGGAVEVLLLEFADGDMLRLPLESAHLVSRFVGAGKAVPKLARLGGTAWRKACTQALGAARDFAADLMKLQAVRSHVAGYAFSPDGEWMRHFEEAFPWEPTPDQAEAIRAVKADMEAARPMDRLLCGDVGFGKTEVAMRAAFKAVMDGRQVAVVAPTTVLVQQHERSFQRRMAEYPVVIRSLSRMQSRAEQQEVLRAMAAGRVDIVIGTHRLLQGDVHFARLGLVVLDEEQKFGVQAKEALKKLRTSVDVLTMSATPIPRTLHLSLAGLRDLSTILSPPANRKSVRTAVHKDDDEVLREACEREMERGGQVFYVHNRVGTIAKAAARLGRLLPGARIGIGHGRMDEDELEAVMAAFVAHELDILVCTTIIESGLDIPNANTIIIERADMFGLAELYQLRGRVGRTERQAWCELLLPRSGVVDGEARERLAAIRRYTHPGAGLKLAMRDLEIRGAGNILGVQQSGHIAAVGFDLYCELLKESVQRLKGLPPPSRRQCGLDLDFVSRGYLSDSPTRLPCGLSPDYVIDPQARLELHRRLSHAEAPTGVDELEAELRDRFGHPGEAELTLLSLTRLRLAGAALGLQEIRVRQDRAILSVPQGPLTLAGSIPRLQEKKPAAKLVELQRLLEYFARLR